MTDVQTVVGAIWPDKPDWIDMDCGISSDGSTMFFSRARFTPETDVPAQSDLMMARLSDGVFSIDPHSESILKNVNSAALEYAPHISSDGLDLYFTRADSLLVGGQNSGSCIRIMIASRKSLLEPFAQPRVISSLRGFVEAPTLPADGYELFFHQKDPHRFAIYRSVRRVK